MRLQSQLVDRGAHPRLLRYCLTETDDEPIGLGSLHAP
jgi:hypothetical protein